MNPDPHSNERLERLVHQSLRELPLRTAPASLEQRVFAELSRRAALPWWQQSFAHWPLPARAAFLVACVGIVKLAFMASVWVMAGLDPAQLREAFASQFTWLHAGIAVVDAIFGTLDLVLRSLPSVWLFGGLALIAGMYAAVFGLGVAAYRAIETSR